jgi:oligo-1,6-glucosidase/alpha-glucosidase
MTSLPWYHRTTIYQIYPRSFYDSNADGIGDLQGIIRKLDYLHDLGFETIWVSPFFSSPQKDLGYDISDYTGIDPEYGTMSDALQLIEKVHKRGMKIVFDMVMNHTSDEHPWFKESRSSRDNPKAGWYLWRDKPNNWKSMTGGSGWHFAPERGQYYWASFLPFQPDLNYRNPEVKKTIFDIVRFWLARGVDGFRLDIFNVIFKDAEFRDNPRSFQVGPAYDSLASFFQERKYSGNQPENFQFAREFRNVCEEFGQKLSIGEVYASKNIIRKFLGDPTNNGLTLVFDFAMMEFQFSADYFHQLLRDMEEHYPDPFMPVYVFGYHDRHRSIYRLRNDLRKAKLLALFQLTVRGVPCMYYGEEIGMTDSRFSFDTALDPIAHKFTRWPRVIPDRLGVLINRDEVRTPMQWDETRNAGFSSAEETWLPVHENYRAINVEKQQAEPDSLLNVVRGLLKLRQQETCLQEGSLEILGKLPKGVLGYARILESKRILILLNFDDRDKEFQTVNSGRLFSLSSGDRAGHEIIHLAGYGGIILTNHG